MVFTRNDLWRRPALLRDAKALRDRRRAPHQEDRPEAHRRRELFEISGMRRWISTMIPGWWSPAFTDRWPRPSADREYWIAPLRERAIGWPPETEAWAPACSGGEKNRFTVLCEGLSRRLERATAGCHCAAGRLQIMSVTRPQHFAIAGAVTGRADWFMHDVTFQGGVGRHERSRKPPISPIVSRTKPGRLLPKTFNTGRPAGWPVNLRKETHEAQTARIAPTHSRRNFSAA